MYTPHMSIYTRRISNYICVYIYMYIYTSVHMYNIYIYTYHCIIYLNAFSTGLVMSKYMPTWVASHLACLPCGIY